MTRAVQRIFFLLCPQCNLRVSPIIVGTVSFVFLQQTIHSHMKFDGQSQNTSTWVIICSETYCIFKILCFLVLVGCFEGFFLNQWKNSAIFQGLSGLLVLPYFYECNRWLHRFLPHTDCSREHLTVQHLKRTPHPGLTGRWNSSVSCSVNFELLKTVCIEMVPIPSQCYSFVKPLEWKFEVFTEIAYWMHDFKIHCDGP